ncbi:MAG: LLM class flavin-dependent oxidoreductase [Nocardioidaceae bacterium]
MPSLHFGVILPNYGPALDAERLAGVARTAEEAGFDSGWVTDHVVVPDEHAATYGTAAEALVSLAFLVGRTQRLQVGVSALVVPQRQPLVTLKQLATIDFLSGGRLLTAVTAGWMEPEFAALGVPYGDRGRRLDAWLELADSVFEQMPGRIRYDDGAVSIDGWMDPAPARPGGPELWAAGVSRATIRRGALLGTWHPVALPPDQLRPMAAELRARRPDSRVVLRIGVYLKPEVQEGVDERGRHAIAGPPDWVAARLSEYVDAGCTGFVLNFDHQSPGLEDRVSQFATEVRPLIIR